MQSFYLEGIGLDKGGGQELEVPAHTRQDGCLYFKVKYNVHGSISSIPDPQMSSSASELTLFCTSSSAPSSAEACLTDMMEYRCKN